jgi:peptidyl-prolyl cis-trans isomerase A (cyclophilin A)
MRPWVVGLLSFSLLAAPAPRASAAIPNPSATDSIVTVEVRTELGAFVVELYPDKAPVTVTNFLRYVDGGFFTGGSFHRTVHADNQPNDSVRIAVIQGDIARGMRGDRFEAIPLERTSKTGLAHRNGTVSMARSGPDTATSSFFVCVGDQPSLDFGGARNPDGQGFAPFGQVVEGMEVVMAINASPADGQTLRPPIAINEIVRIPSS